MRPDIQEIVKLRAENDRLREELRQMRAAFMPCLWFPATWGLTKAQTNALSALCARRGGVSQAGLQIAICGLEPKSTLKAVVVQVCHLRRKLRPHGIEIETLWGRGFRLSDAGRAIVEPYVRRLQEAA